MAETYQAKKLDFAPKNIIHEISYRDRRIIQTDDPRLVGTEDSWGFKLQTGFVVRDEFDEVVLPSPLCSWFWNPADAVSAIEILDTVLPMEHPNSTLTYEYGRMWAMRYHFGSRVYTALKRIRQACENAVALEDNPAQDVLSILNTLEQSIMER